MVRASETMDQRAAGSAAAAPRRDHDSGAAPFSRAEIAAYMA
jgi:hypothetical protein